MAIWQIRQVAVLYLHGNQQDKLHILSTAIDSDISVQ